MRTFILMLNKTAVIFLVLFSAVALLSSGCGRDESAEDFEAAEVLLGDGRHEEALRKYQSILDAHPTGAYAAESQYKVALIYGKYLGDRERALDAYAELFYLHPRSDVLEHAARERALLHSSAGEHLGAVEDLKWLVENGWDKDEYRRMLGMEYMRLGDYGRARDEFGRALGNDAAEIRLRIAETLYLEGNHAAAIAAYDAAVRGATNARAAAEAKYGRALALDASGMTADALDVLKAIENDYPNREALRARITLFEEKLADLADDGGTVENGRTESKEE